MPELPEVETVVRGLRPILVGRTFAKVKSQAPPTSIVVSRSFRKRKLENLLPDRTVQSINRRGKNILISLSGESTLWVHLKMTGKFHFVDRALPRGKHDLVMFDLRPQGNGTDNLQLRFNDYRRFGRLRLFPDSELWSQPGLVELGPEPLEMSADQFIELCHRRPRLIKAALLDQNFIAGVGNIYADESLFAARIHPLRLTTSVSAGKLRELHSHLLRLLKHSIKMMGTTVFSFGSINGRSGEFQNFLQVYNHEDEPCPRCGAKIIRRKLGPRSAHFCPRCQRYAGS